MAASAPASPSTAPAGATIDARRAARSPKSIALYERARRALPSGVTHDSRHHSPFGIYVTHAQGSRKWDVDGHEYVDYRMGHGALLLGHNYPSVTDAVVAQAQKGTHYGANHELEIRWAELVEELVPSAEQVKFFSSGTEATMMAMRLARAFTGRSKILKTEGGFHGWHDFATVAMQAPLDVPYSRGIPRGVVDSMVAVRPRDAAAVERALASDPDIAAVILIADGAGTEYLQAVNEIAHRHGALVIYDEVVTGFRYAPGGAQKHYGVTPDMTTLAKILAGGLPGAAIAARRDILSLFELRDDDAEWSRFGRIPHPGTFNANPLSAAAGVACLDVVRDPAIQRRATDTARTIRSGVRDVFARRGVEGTAGGDDAFSFVNVSFSQPRVRGSRFQHLFRSAMQLNGVDFSGSFIVSAVHDGRDVAQTLDAFDQAVALMQEDNAL